MKKLNKIYIVDDDELYQFITKMIIEETQSVSEIKTFSNGQAAIDGLQADMNDKTCPEIIFLDLTMPVMDGWGFLQKYKTSNTCRDAKIYVVSSSVNPVDVEKAKSHPTVSDYLLKPFTKEKFQSLL
jgi:CheY-like chemotaxis protein